MSLTHLLYLHGFRSSPQSAKARLMEQHLELHHPQVHFWCPQLPPSPQVAMQLVAQGIQSWPHTMAVVGSSLGGFYATWVAQQKACPSVMLNPAVHPARDLARYIGELSSWHQPEDRFFFREEYIQELRDLDMRAHAQRAAELAIIAKGDELLDWREMQARYPQAQHILLEGGDHALSTFAEHLPAIDQFLGLQPHG